MFSYPPVIPSELFSKKIFLKKRVLPGKNVCGTPNKNTYLLTF